MSKLAENNEQGAQAPRRRLDSIRVSWVPTGIADWREILRKSTKNPVSLTLLAAIEGWLLLPSLSMLLPPERAGLASFQVQAGPPIPDRPDRLRGQC